MRILTDAFSSLADWRTLQGDLAAGRTPLAAFGLMHIGKVTAAATLCRKQGKKLLYLTADEAEASRVMEDLTAMGLNTLFYPLRDYAPQAVFGSSMEFQQLRIGTLSNLLEGAFDVVVATAMAALSPTLPPATLQGRCRTLKVGDCIPVEDLARLLQAAGYTRTPKVEGKGQFSLRGGIFDLFPPDAPLPLRIDFFGDEIDRIYAFDLESQRRCESVSSVHITPSCENAPDSAEQLAAVIKDLLATEKKMSEARKARLTDDLARLGEGLPVAYDAYLPQIYGGNSTLLDYFTDGVVAVSETSRIKEAYTANQRLAGEETTALIAEGALPTGFKGYLAPYTDLLLTFEQRPTLFLEAFPKSGFDVAVKSTVHFSLLSGAVYSGTMESLAEDLKENKSAVLLLAGEEKAAKTYAEELSRRSVAAIWAKNPSTVQKGSVVVTTGTLSGGIEMPELNLRVVCVSKNTGKKRKNRFKKGEDIGSLDELKPGDYVVHVAHGIGVFDGVHQLTTSCGTKDYIKIRYQGKDVLYVPVSALDMVSRYIGNTEDTSIKLNKLGGTEWVKTKTRVKSAVKDIAKQLIKLYAERMQQKGYAFSPDTDLQQDFEARFPYEETEDQLRCIHEIKQDMESAVPMDRLLCGDVGFGKTEVALRAAFKCIADGKQCAILVPTTILAWQHYRTAGDRFGTLPVTVEMLSRFRTPTQQTKIKKDLKSGQIDLIIGTHRLISKDIAFKDLGLLIIDEEQRFGVAQKERLKELFPDIDVLTLSATPIPRTLNMALSGLRDMSSIEEAPGDRYPVQTYVMEQDAGLLLEAIQKELRRGGQVYYLHNKVESIVSCAARLQSQLPEARIGVAHGKMSEEELSRIWQQLLEHEIDVLVCTTIIETGVDVPNANTLIIENADRMGLAQLHQLRGRVGRSHRRAYAYLCIARGHAVSEIAAKRLDAIREYTQFGSGFKIAMRDLEIRGAGNILGGEQSGHMESVGYDMYLKLLNDAIDEEKGVEKPQKQECTVELQIGAHIPEKYISELSARLGMYRRIAAIRSPEDADDVRDELQDRFGPPPVAVDQLIEVALLKSQAAALGIYEVVQRQAGILLYSNDFDPERVTALLKGMRKRVFINAGKKPYIAVKPKPEESPLQTLSDALSFLTPEETEK